MEMTDLEALFVEREEHYYETTEAILRLLGPVTLNGIIQYLRLGDLNEDGLVRWQDVQIQDYIVTVLGVISYPPGSEFTTEAGEKIPVSEDNKDYFTRVVKIGIPADIAINGDTDAVVEFLATAKRIDAESMEDLENSLQAEAVAQSTTGSGEYDFNLDELTEEQRQSLQLSPVGKTRN